MKSSKIELAKKRARGSKNLQKYLDMQESRLGDNFTGWGTGIGVIVQLLNISPLVFDSNTNTTINVNLSHNVKITSAKLRKTNGTEYNLSGNFPIDDRTLSFNNVNVPYGKYKLILLDYMNNEITNEQFVATTTNISNVTPLTYTSNTPFNLTATYDETVTIKSAYLTYDNNQVDINDTFPKTGNSFTFNNVTLPYGGYQLNIEDSNGQIKTFSSLIKATLTFTNVSLTTLTNLDTVPDFNVELSENPGFDSIKLVQQSSPFIEYSFPIASISGNVINFTGINTMQQGVYVYEYKDAINTINSTQTITVSEQYAVVKQLAPNAFDDVAFFITLTFSALFALQPDLEMYFDGELIDTPTKEGALPDGSFKYKMTRIVPAGKYKLKFPEKKKDIADSSLTVEKRVWNKVAFDNLPMGTQHVIQNNQKDVYMTAPYEIVDFNTGNRELPIPWRFDFFFDKRSENFYFFVSKIDELGLGMGPGTQTGDPGLITLDESTDTFWLRHSQFDVDREIWRNTGVSMTQNGFDILSRFSDGYDRRYCMLAYDGFDLIYLDSDVSTIPYYDPAAPVIRIPTKTPLAKITWIWRDSSNDGSDLEIGWYTPTYAQDSFV